MPGKKKLPKAPHKPIQVKPKPVEIIDPDYHLKNARAYPYGDCWLDVRFKKEGFGLTQVLVSRIQPNGRIIFAIFVVDILCLGVKDCVYHVDYSKSNFMRKLELVTPERELITPAYANGLIYGAIEFAARYGFSPHRSFEQASLVLDPPGVYPPPEDIEFGGGGKPLFVAGPYDDTEKIFNQLLKTAGEGNFDFLLPINPG